MTAFAQAFGLILGSEGGYTTNLADPGNWTGGSRGRGTCAGTNWGISAAAYPTVNIRSLTRDQALAIYRRDYWDRVHGDALPGPLAFLVADAAVNCGVGKAARWLQAALGVVQDGAIGPETLAAVTARHGQGGALLVEYQARRAFATGLLATWRTFGLGWARRLFRDLALAVTWEDQA